MDVTTIAGAALVSKTGQTQQTLSMAMIKQTANQQNLIANLLAQSVQQAPQPDSSYNFSTYA